MYKVWKGYRGKDSDGWEKGQRWIGRERKEGDIERVEYRD